MPQRQKLLRSQSRTWLLTFNLFVCLVLYLFFWNDDWTENAWIHTSPNPSGAVDSNYEPIGRFPDDTFGVLPNKRLEKLFRKYKKYSTQWDSTEARTGNDVAGNAGVSKGHYSFIYGPNVKADEPSGDKNEELEHRGRFQREWQRQRRHRMDWRSLLRPCAGQMEWRQATARVKKTRTNAAASTIHSWDIRPAGEFSKFFIQSRTIEGRAKRFGGDWWRVYLEGPSSLSASVFDHNNGTYEALFLILEPGVYKVEITLDYSLCDGLRDPPRDWFIRGNAQGKYQKEGILGHLDDYLLEDFNNGTPMTVRIRPNRFNSETKGKLGLQNNSCSKKCSFLWDGFGRWVNNQWKPYIERSHQWKTPGWLASTGTFWSYGDSLALRLFWSVNSRALCTWLYDGCKASYNWIYPVENEEIGKKRDDDLDFDGPRVSDTIREVLRSPVMDNRASTLLLNIGLHFPVSLNFSTYQELIRDVVNMLKKPERLVMGYEVPQYKTKVIWKTNTAIRKERVKKLNSTNWRFFTTQRVYLFSVFATSVFCQAGYDVIDVFPLTDSYPGGMEDEVHYPNHVFASVEQMLEKHKADPETFRKESLRVCPD